MEHNFDADLEQSKRDSNLPIWPEIYAQAFPGYRALKNYANDLDKQARGIDRGVITHSGTEILIDEKARYLLFSDILLEYCHIYNDGHETPGWIEKDLEIDFIAYAILPLGVCYLLSFSHLKAVWARYKNRLLWKTVRSPNNRAGRRWVTLNVPISGSELWELYGSPIWKYSFNHQKYLDEAVRKEAERRMKRK